jgi:HD-GYP domain-containing protein (c-di-GMP phosphodiesterase class II)
MDTQATKIALVREILNIENIELIEKVAKLLKEEKKDFWNDLSASKKEEIEKADIEILNEETTSYEVFMASDRNTKLNFIKDFINLKDKETINKLQHILWKKNDFWNDLSASQQEEINLGIKQLDEGKNISWEDFLAKVS